MKIMFCLGSMTKGGAERVIANLSNELINKYDISIVVTPPDKPMYELNKNINYFTLDSTVKRENIIKRTIRRIYKLRKIIKSYNPDIIVSLLPEPSFRVMIAKKGLNKKAIISIRNDPNVEYNNVLKRLFVKLLYTKADGFVFQTAEAQKWFSKKIQKKSVIIPNPINKQFICKPFCGVREKTIINVGRLTKQKNQSLLIDAFNDVHSKYPEYILKIYGSGELREQLQNQVNLYGLKESVFLMGDVNNIKNEIYKSGIFVLSSDYEGMPNSLMEAMALGLPCISTDCPIGGPKFLINNNENGILVKVNDKNELVNAIIFYIENNEKAINYGKNANKICEILNPKVVNYEWEKYINLIKGE